MADQTMKQKSKENEKEKELEIIIVKEEQLIDENIVIKEEYYDPIRDPSPIK